MYLIFQLSVFISVVCLFVCVLTLFLNWAAKSYLHVDLCHILLLIWPKRNISSSSAGSKLLSSDPPRHESVVWPTGGRRWNPLNPSHLKRPRLRRVRLVEQVWRQRCACFEHHWSKCVSFQSKRTESRRLQTLSHLQDSPGVTSGFTPSTRDGRIPHKRKHLFGPWS